jgi:hypothetical protein
MVQCERCGKLIDATADTTRCRTCRDEEDASEVVTPPRPAPPKEPVVSDDEPFGKEPCVRCRKHLAMVDSEFCLACQLELLSLLGDAAHELFNTPPPPPKPKVSSSVSLMSEIEDKRSRTATSHIRVVGGAKIK